MKCSVEGCPADVARLNYCYRHYKRFRRHGDPLKGRIQEGISLQFLKDNVDYNSDECLIWPFGKSDDGRGKVRYKGKDTYASRVMCELAYGPAPIDRPQAAHRCGNGFKACVNPKHLYWANQSMNEQDKLNHGTYHTRWGNENGKPKPYRFQKGKRGPGGSGVFNAMTGKLEDMSHGIS